MKQAQREVTEAGSRVQINILDFKYNCMYNFNMEANMHVCACLCVFVVDNYSKTTA